MTKITPSEMVENTSPVPEEVPARLMDFYEALQQAALGKRIHKVAWNDANIFGMMQEGRLRIKLADGQFHDWIITDGDFVGKDWIVL